MKQERDILELLILLRDTILTDGCNSGMCMSIFYMYALDHSISVLEKHIVDNYLDAHQPRIRYLGGYWYPAGWVWPRLRWLNRQIRRLSRERGSKNTAPII